jgi:hypothetical protein
VKTGKIHPVKIIFGIPICPDKMIERFVYAYIIEGERLFLIDTGVAGELGTGSDQANKLIIHGIAFSAMLYEALQGTF